jgi:hypothetical protein
MVGKASFPPKIIKRPMVMGPQGVVFRSVHRAKTNRCIFAHSFYIIFAQVKKMMADPSVSIGF